MTLRVLDLFSGIGGFSLGLERTGGFRTVAFCEIEPYCRAVLAKHWPGVPCYDDVRALTADTLRRDGITVDVICGGFPCQDLSFAGKRAGLEGARSGLWSEYARLIGELRPRYVIVENVPGLLSLGMGDVLGSLSTLGYDATWDCVPASAVGAPHRRDRVWLIAYASRDRRAVGGTGNDGRSIVAQVESANRQFGRNVANHGAQPVAHAKGDRWRENVVSFKETTRRRPATGQFAGSYQSAGRQWLSEPNVGRVATRVPARVDRLRSLGNAVVPQIPELLGRAILRAEGLAA